MWGVPSLSPYKRLYRQPSILCASCNPLLNTKGHDTVPTLLVLLSSLSLFHLQFYWRYHSNREDERIKKWLCAFGNNNHFWIFLAFWGWRCGPRMQNTSSLVTSCDLQHGFVRPQPQQSPSGAKSFSIFLEAMTASLQRAKRHGLRCGSSVWWRKPLNPLEVTMLKRTAVFLLDGQWWSNFQLGAN